MARSVYKIIKKTTKIIIKNNGEKLYETINSAKTSLIKKGFLIDIFNVYNSKTLDTFSKKNKNNIIIASVWLGSTRLIDNKKFRLLN